MTWITQIKNDFIIRTYDGKEYKVNWLNASVQTEYHTSEFNFIDVKGTLVKRKEPLGNKYNLEFYFQGENNIDKGKEFRKSCEDRRPWVLFHPLYDRLVVQPTSLLFDDSDYNATKVTGTVIETIEDVVQSIDEPLLDRVEILVLDSMDEMEVSFTGSEVTPQDVNTLASDNEKIYSTAVRTIDAANQSQFEEYYAAFNTANTYINTATATPILMMRSVMNVVLLPAKFQINVKTRIKTLIDTFNLMRATLFGLTAVSSKKIFQNKLGANICALCQAAATPLPNNYRSATSILEVIEQVQGAFNQYIDDLDFLQTPNGGDVLSFVPSDGSLLKLSELVNTTLSGLYQLALNAKQERVYVCEKDTNVILLTHRFYGLENEDNIDFFMDSNDILEDEYWQIQKGREVKYFV